MLSTTKFFNFTHSDVMLPPRTERALAEKIVYILAVMLLLFAGDKWNISIFVANIL